MPVLEVDGDGESPGLELVLTASDAETKHADKKSSRGLHLKISEETEESGKDVESQRSNYFSPIGATIKALDYVIPKIERIPWHHFLLLSLLVAIPAAAYIIGFTKLGYGLQTYYTLSQYFEQHAYLLALSLAVFAFLLYLFDIQYWSTKAGRMMRYLAISIVVLGSAMLVCFISTTLPYGPISMYMVLTPMWLVLCKHIFYPKLEMRTYVPWLSGPLFFNALVIMAIWLYWTFVTASHEWTETTRIADAQISGCIPDLTTYSECHKEDSPGKGTTTRGLPISFTRNDVCFQIDPKNPKIPEWNDECPENCMKVYDNCSNMFIVWVGPFLVSLGLLFLSFFATFLKATGTIEQEALKFAKLWFFLLFAMWIASSLAGAGAGVSVTLAALTLSAFIASAILLASSFTHVERSERVKEVWNNLLEKYESHLNIAKGLLVVTTTPVFCVYLAVSFLVQFIRNINLPCSKDAKPNTESLRDVVGEGYVSVEARRLIREIKSWDLVDVYTYAVYWGIGFMTFAVLASKFTTLFLSWLIEETKEMSIPVVTGILIGVGSIMFLLPPVPGAPIYLTFGIVIVPVGRESFGIPLSILYAIGVSLVLKLFATFLQQKGIGALLSNRVSVRQMVKINAPLLRASKLVLAEPGFGMAKVSILCGGPDWPTSVLCGIMGLPLTPILVGTLPVIVLVVPMVLTGSFTYMTALKLEDGQPAFTWAGTAATVSTAAAAIVLFGFMFLAAYHVEQTMRNRGDEIKEIPIDPEVKKLDDETALMNVAYSEVTEWSIVPAWAKFVLILSVVCQISSCYIVQLFQEDAFQSYQVTDTIAEKLNGDWKNLVTPLGQIALLIFVLSIVLLLLFQCWAKGKAKQKREENNDQQSDAITNDET